MKTEIKQFRVDEESAKIIKEICKAENIKFSEYIRILIDKDFFARNLIN